MIRSATNPNMFELDFKIQRRLHLLRTTRRNLLDHTLFVENSDSASNSLASSTILHSFVCSTFVRTIDDYVGMINNVNGSL